MKKVLAIILGVIIFIVPFFINPPIQLTNNKLIVFALVESVSIGLFAITIGSLYSDYIDKWRKDKED